MTVTYECKYHGFQGNADFFISRPMYCAFEPGQTMRGICSDPTWAQCGERLTAFWRLPLSEVSA